MDALGISPTTNANEFTTVESMSGMSDLSSPLMNLTVDAGNASGASDLYEVPLGLVVLLSFLYGSISVIAVLGNALVIIVIIKNRPMHTVTNFFIANLASADVLIGTFSIPFQFQAAVMQRWDLPAFMCPLAPFVKQVSVTVSITTLAVISIDRYFAVIHPLKPHCSKTKAYIAMGFVWFFSIASSVPMAVVFRFIHVPDADADVPGDTKPFCRPFWPQNHVVDWNKLYSLYLSITQYFFPLIIISFAYFRIMCKIWGNRAPGSAVDCRDRLLNKNKRKVIKMLMIVVALFALCWLPIQSYNLLSEITSEINEYKYINIIFFGADWLAMSNSCYNPFIYGLLNEKYKRGFRMLFRKCPCKCCRTEAPDFYPDFSDDSLEYRKSSSSCPDDFRVQTNGGRPKRYARVTTSMSFYEN